MITEQEPNNSEFPEQYREEFNERIHTIANIAWQYDGTKEKLTEITDILSKLEKWMVEIFGVQKDVQCLPFKEEEHIAAHYTGLQMGVNAACRVCSHFTAESCMPP